MSIRETISSALILMLAPLSLAAINVDFEDLTLAPESASYKVPFSSRGAQFSNDYNPEWDSWSGFAYSNMSDTETRGFTNQFSAITGAGYGGSGIYGIAYAWNPTDAEIVLPAGQFPVGMWITNTTYAYWSMMEGDFFGKKFGGPTGNDPDWFKVTAVGYSGNTQTGTVEFYLADFRFTDNSQDYIVADWTWWDLTPLGSANRIFFTFDSSDVGPFGMNTPAYFAMDNLQTVPEPGTLIASSIGLAFWAVRRRGGRQ